MKSLPEDRSKEKVAGNGRSDRYRSSSRDSRSEQQGAVRTFWATHGLVTVLTAFMTAVVTITVSLIANRAINDSGSNRNDAAPTTVSTTNPSASPATVASSSVGTDTAAQTPAASGNSNSSVLWHRKIHLPYEYGLDLANDSPKVKYLGGDFSTATFGGRDGPGFVFWGNTAAGSATSAKPSFAMCRDALDTNAVGSTLITRVGKTICVRSGDDQAPHLAAIHILAWNTTDSAMDVDVTVQGPGVLSECPFMRAAPEEDSEGGQGPGRVAGVVAERGRRG